MDLKSKISQLLEEYSEEKYEINSPSFFANKKRKSILKSMLSSQISLILINAINEICKDTGLTKRAVVEQLIYLGLISMEFDGE